MTGLLLGVVAAVCTLPALMVPPRGLESFRRGTELLGLLHILLGMYVPHGPSTEHSSSGSISYSYIEKVDYGSSLYAPAATLADRKEYVQRRDVYDRPWRHYAKYCKWEGDCNCIRL